LVSGLGTSAATSPGYASGYLTACPTNPTTDPTYNASSSGPPPSTLPPGLNPTNGSIQNADNISGQWFTPGTPGEFDLLPAALLYGITPGTPGEASKLAAIWQTQWNTQYSDTPAGGPPGGTPQVSPPSSFPGSALDFLSFATAGYFSGAFNGLPPGPSWTTLIGPNCAKAAKVIQTYVAQYPKSPIPESLLLETTTCSNHP
jgi:hypothetical protein